MLRFTFVAVVGITGLVALPVIRAVSQEPPLGEIAPAQKGVVPAQRPAQELLPQVPGAAVPQAADLLAVIFGRGATKLEPAELAGMAPGSRPAVLTLEQAYLLTLIRTRNPSGVLAVARANFVDPTALDEEARRVGALDFDRFRREFLSGGFRDPAPGFFKALKRRQAVDSARDRVALTKDMRLLFDELLRGESSGVSQMQIELVGFIGSWAPCRTTTGNLFIGRFFRITENQAILDRVSVAPIVINVVRVAVAAKLHGAKLPRRRKMPRRRRKNTEGGIFASSLQHINWQWFAESRGANGANGAKSRDLPTPAEARRRSGVKMED